MTYHPQSFVAPDGTEMVILPAAEFERLRSLAEDIEDTIDAKAELERIANGEGMPDEVLGLILEEDMTPLAAWRRYRGLSQAALAQKAGLSQVWVGRVETGGGYGSQRTRRALAKALDAPPWALELDTTPEGAAGA
jgi:DNA-binding XRE family transcriptional regulator